MKDEDVIEHLVVASTHDTMLLFSSRGKVYWLKTYEMPNASRGSRGKPLVNLLPLDADESISAVLPVREYRADSYIFFATSNGTVKRTSLDQFSRPRSVGLIAIDIDEGDRLIGAAITSGSDHVMMLSSNGKAIRFEEGNVRAMGRTARGVRGMRLLDGAQVISLIIPQSQTIDAEADAEAEKPADAVEGEGNSAVNDEQIYILTGSENGYGKRTRLEEFPLRGRGGQGVIAMQTTARNGSLVAAMQVRSSDEMMLITDRGTLVRTRVAEVSISSRNTQGVTLIRTGEDEHLVKTVRVDEPQDDELLDAEAIDADADQPASDTAGDTDADRDAEADDGELDGGESHNDGSDDDGVNDDSPSDDEPRSE
jgi:DNA gyrase subunit A